MDKFSADDALRLSFAAMTPSEKTARLQFLATLDALSEAERTNLLEIEPYEELTELFCLCCDEYGEHTDVLKTLARITWDRTPGDTMENARYEALMGDDDAKLTPAEKADGWHWCREFDNLLVGPGMGELKHCHCLVPDHPMYKTAETPQA